LKSLDSKNKTLAKERKFTNRFCAVFFIGVVY